MTASAEIMSEPATAAPPAYSFARLMQWCIRRELWENRALVIAPLATAGVLVFALAFTAFHFAGGQGLKLEFGDNQSIHIGDGDPRILLVFYGIAALPIVIVGVMVALSYCLNALHGERRDRSILFWKSLPVSDLTTVLSKASIPLVLMPLITFAIGVVTAMVMLTMVVLTIISIPGFNPTDLWTDVPVGQLTVDFLYGLFAMALWHAPIYAWLLLVSAWARRSLFLWAIAPLIGLQIIEKIVFGTNYVNAMVQYRTSGGILAGFAYTHVAAGNMPQIALGQFLSNPGLWGGLAVAVLFLGATVLLRRYRQPI